MDNRVRSAFESIKDVSVSTTKQIEKLKKEMSQGKNIQPFFSTIAASGQESITPQ